MRKCKICGAEKPLEQFRKTGLKDYRAHECKACTSIRLKEWNRKNAEYRKQYRREYHEENRDQIIARVTAWSKQNPDRRRANAREYYYRIQEQCIAAYGGNKCSCCGETEPLFLTLDHVDSDGSKHRKEIGTTGGQKLYRWLIKNNFPKGFQVLCSNCNHGRFRNGGVCPHKQGVTTREKSRSAKRREAHHTPRG